MICGGVGVKENGRGRRCGCCKEQKKQGRVCDVAGGPPRKQAAAAKQRSKQELAAPPPPPSKAAARPPKAVDEDLYKIPPHLLHSSKRVPLLLLLPLHIFYYF